jgi:hypothetical protein
LLIQHFLDRSSPSLTTIGFGVYLPSREIVVFAAPVGSHEIIINHNKTEDSKKANCSITHQPQNEFEKPLTALNCAVVIDETPPNIEEYGNLRERQIRHQTIEQGSHRELT